MLCADVGWSKRYRYRFMKARASGRKCRSKAAQITPKPARTRSDTLEAMSMYTNNPAYNTTGDDASMVRAT
jgi:hypothetical protein